MKPTKECIQEVFEIIFMYEGLRCSDVVKRMNTKRNLVEDAIWELYATGRIQCDPDSTLRPAREGEIIQRWDD